MVFVMPLKALHQHFNDYNKIEMKQRDAGEKCRGKTDNLSTENSSMCVIAKCNNNDNNENDNNDDNNENDNNDENNDGGE